MGDVYAYLLSIALGALCSINISFTGLGSLSRLNVTYMRISHLYNSLFICLIRPLQTPSLKFKRHAFLDESMVEKVPGGGTLVAQLHSMWDT
jgi:hypothetical protein